MTIYLVIGYLGLGLVIFTLIERYGRRKGVGEDFGFRGWMWMAVLAESAAFVALALWPLFALFYLVCVWCEMSARRERAKLREFEARELRARAENPHHGLPLDQLLAVLEKKKMETDAVERTKTATRS